jgi:glucan phosphoethanolaminetransferase (alkaline phosphatase superfamily)
MSVAAIATILVFISLYGTAPQADEGAAAHFFQLLMVAQVPIILYFAIRWFPRSQKNAFLIIALQIGAAVAAIAPVFLLGW